MAVELCPLFSLEKQFQAKNGANNTNGFLKVFLAGTDDPATTYSDYVGTLNPQKIVLDDNGRAVVICDKAKAYRLEVYDADGMLLWTEEPKYCTGNGGGGVATTRVISTDGSISVGESIVGSQRTYDIGIAPSDSDEFLEWAKCIDEDVPNGVIYPTFVDGTMETEAGKGLHVGKDRFYHITASFRVYPSGTGINYESLTTELKFNDGTSTSLLIRRTYDIDNSLHDSVMCEFSYDFKATADGYLFFQLDNVTTFHDVAVVMQVHRIYSGINAVPDTCATKQWVQETFDYNLSGKIGYSALEYNPTGEISGISGSAIATTDPARVSAIASSYAESAVSSISAWSGEFSSISSKLDASASSQFQPSGDYAYVSSLSAYVEKTAYSAFSSEVTNNISSISSTVSGLTGQYIEQSASGMFQPSGNYVSSTDMSAYVPFSGLEGDGSKITGISGSAIKGHEYTGISPVVVDNTADTISVEHRTLCVDSTMTAYNSGSSAVIGVNVEGLNLSSKMDASASSLFYSTSNPSGFLTGVDLTPYQLTADMSAYQLSGDYAFNSSLLAKMDASASSSFYSTSNPSGFITGVDLTPYQLTADMSAYAHESSLSAKLDASASGEFYSTSNPSGFIDDSSASAIASAYQVVSSIGTSQNGLTSVVTSVNSQNISATYAYFANKAFNDGTGRVISSLPDSAAVSAIASSYAESAVSGKLDESATAGFYPTSNPSGFISGVDLTPYQTTADMSAYQLSGDYAYNSSLSSKLDASASSQFAPSGDYMSSVSVDSNMSGDGTTAYPLGLNTLVTLSAQGKKGYVYLNGTAGSLTISGDTARFQGTGNNTMNVSFNCKPSAKGAIFIGPWSASNAWAGFSAQYSAGNINAYLRASGSGTAGLTLWDTDGSAQMQKSSIAYWNDKQDASAMTAYQPVGTYIYESALGWAEV